MKISPTSYSLENLATKRIFKDSGWLMSDPEYDSPSLIRAIYQNKKLNVGKHSRGIYRFADWMPIHKMLKGSFAPLTYKSEGLAKYFNLPNLYITFSGYWPEKRIEMKTCSFKETEAFSVCARFPDNDKRTLVVSSAGNTARAFARVCSENEIPIVITIPEENMDAMWFKEKLNDCVKVVCAPYGSDYFDAIQLGNKICQSPDFVEEGGAKNIARRDGMSTTVLSAATFIGRIPDIYFQAIGSGTGTIAAHEANLRLIEDGSYGKNIMKLIPSQNVPFTPMYDAWKQQSRALLPFDEDEARKIALQIKAKVLSNRKPPYSIPGGLFDCLSASNGAMEIVTNEELAQACEMFEKLEGIDIYSAAGVAVKSMEKALANGKINKDDIIMLNITGGGEKRFKKDHMCYMKQPDLVIPNNTPAEEVIKKVQSLF